MKNILLVEDDSFLIEIYSGKLREEGFFVEVVSKGEEVLPRVKEKKPDLIILDIALPQVDGREILKQIKQCQELKNIKIVILSELGQKEEAEKWPEFEEVKSLIKAHFTPSQIIEEIKRII
jgi:CheY-like chemotaxis protein